MSLEVVVKDASGTRTLNEQDLPLHVGTSPDADIRIPGAVVTAFHALIGLLDERAFVQVPGRANVTVNGERIYSTGWLKNNDTLVVEGVKLACELSAQSFTVTVAGDPYDYPTAPPLPAGATADAGGSEPAQTFLAGRPRELVRPAAGQDAGRTVRIKPVQLILGLLLLTAAYIFSASTVLVVPDQETATINLPGSWLTPGGEGRYLLWPGTYAVQIEAPGFYTLREDIEVEFGVRQEFPFTLKELPGRVSFQSAQAADGEIWINEKPLGTLGGEPLLLDKGNYEYRVRTARYLEYIGMLEVRGRDQPQTVTVELVPGWADVSVTTVPTGVEVLSDGEVLGITPAVVELLAGEREVMLRKSGYRSEQRTLNIVAGQAEELPLIELEETGGLIRITSSPAGAAVTLQDKYMGLTPLELEVAKAQSYTLRLSRSGYKGVTRSITVPDGTPVAVSISMTPVTGTIDIAVEPADAELYVDGKRIGTGSQQLELIAVAHRLEVRKAGLETWSASVNPTPGLPQQFKVRLLTRREAVLAATPKTLTTGQGTVLQLVEPGEFSMGAPRREQGRRPNEVLRDVRLTQHFYIARTEVTNREFRQFRPEHTSGAEKYRELAADNHPVVMLSWRDAAAYCNWLSKKDGLEPAYIVKGAELVLSAEPVTGYRLPTEAEWVWVARYSAGGGELKYPWGQTLPPVANAGNFADASAVDVTDKFIGDYNDGYPVTAPVGSFRANPVGIYDLGGNVAEWVNDYYAVGSSSNERLIDPVGPSEGQYHVIRGSGWRDSSISTLRYAYRDFGDRGRLDVGFRIARYAPLGGGDK